MSDSNTVNGELFEALAEEAMVAYLVFEEVDGSTGKCIYHNKLAYSLLELYSLGEDQELKIDQLFPDKGNDKFRAFSQDILHLAPRPILIEDSYKSAWVEQSAHDDANMLVSFTRLGVPRIDLYPTENGLARVSYLLEDTSLYRLSWTYLDLQQRSKPQKSLVFTNVEKATFNAKFPPVKVTSASRLNQNVKLYVQFQNVN